MAGCVGVPTSRVDTWAFGLGSGVAGLGGVALSQIGNVGPDLGQALHRRFVHGGGARRRRAACRHRRAPRWGSASSTSCSKSWSGAVIAKIAVLVFIILFIQKRPQGLFALKGRAVEA